MANYLIKTYLVQKYPDYFEKTYFLEPELEYKYLYICINKSVPNSEKKLKDFNEGLLKFQRTGKLKKIIQSAGFNERGIWTIQ